jgi:putative tributyrin esterase
MGLFRFNYRSQTLGKYVNITIAYPTDDCRCKPTEYLAKQASILPTDENTDYYVQGMKFQTVYLLHGGGDDDSLTYRYTNAERYAQRNKVMLVTPDIANSFGADTQYGIPYETFVTEELPTVVQALFASSPKREDNFIMGYAMGGNAALAAALHRPDRYCACMDISGGIGMTLQTGQLQSELDGGEFVQKLPLYGATFGEGQALPGSQYDLFAAAQRGLQNGGSHCRFIIACGSLEFIRERVEADVQVLKGLGYEVEYHCAEGYRHDFEMWNDWIEKGLDSLLPLKRSVLLPQV